jgi:hypothetical protein
MASLRRRLYNHYFSLMYYLYIYLDEDVEGGAWCAGHFTTRYFIMYTHIAVPTSTSFPSHAKDTQLEALRVIRCVHVQEGSGGGRDTPRLVHVATRHVQRRYLQYTYSCQSHRQATQTGKP